jgi:hypothetical protein
LSRAAVFQAQPPVCVWTVPVRTHTPLPSVNDPKLLVDGESFQPGAGPYPTRGSIADTAPVEELAALLVGADSSPLFMVPYELQDGLGESTNGIPDRDKVIASLWTRGAAFLQPPMPVMTTARRFTSWGWLHPNANNGGASGYASTVSNQSWVQLPEPYAQSPSRPAGIAYVPAV